MRVHSERRDAGLSLVEVIIAVATFTILGVAGLYGLSGALTLVSTNGNRSTAAYLAAEEVERARATEFSLLPVGLTESTKTVGGVRYTIRREAEFVAQSSTAGACDGPSGTVRNMRLTVSITWPNMHGVAPVTSQTMIAAPAGAYDANTGHLAVKVLDRNAAPASGVLVRVSTMSLLVAQQLTTSQGCAFFAYLSPNTYTVDLTSVDRVDGQGAITPSQTVGVPVGSSVSVVFGYDHAAALLLTLSGAAGGAPPPDVPVTLANTSLLPAGTRWFAGSGATRTIGGLFPYLAGYQAWAGDCADADPHTSVAGVPVYPGASRGPAIASNPVQTSIGTVSMVSADVQVTRLGLPVPGATVLLHHDPDAGCASGSDLVAGVTDAAGTLRVAAPYGRWEVRVQSATPVGAWPVQVVGAVPGVAVFVATIA